MISDKLDSRFLELLAHSTTLKHGILCRRYSYEAYSLYLEFGGKGIVPYLTCLLLLFFLFLSPTSTPTFPA